MKDKNGKDIKRENKRCTGKGIVFTTNKKDGTKNGKWQIDYPDRKIGKKGHRYSSATNERKIAIFFNLLGEGIETREADAIAFRLTKKSGKYAEIRREAVEKTYNIKDDEDDDDEE